MKLRSGGAADSNRVGYHCFYWKIEWFRHTGSSEFISECVNSERRYQSRMSAEVINHRKEMRRVMAERQESRTCRHETSRLPRSFYKSSSKDRSIISLKSCRVFKQLVLIRLEFGQWCCWNNFQNSLTFFVISISSFVHKYIKNIIFSRWCFLLWKALITDNVEEVGC